MAPPAIAVHSMPEKEPWNLGMLFKASEKIMAYITERQNPSAGNPKTGRD